MQRVHNIQKIESRRKELQKKFTPQKNALWEHLRRKNLGYRFRRQHSIDCYIVDFYCAKKKLVIELDGSQHKEHQEYDAARTHFLESLGMTVLRFWNDEIDNRLHDTILKIQKYLSISFPPLS